MDDKTETYVVFRDYLTDQNGLVTHRLSAAWRSDGSVQFIMTTAKADGKGLDAICHIMESDDVQRFHQWLTDGFLD